MLGTVQLLWRNLDMGTRIMLGVGLFIASAIAAYKENLADLYAAFGYVRDYVPAAHD